MPSQAFNKFQQEVLKADNLSALVGHSKLRPQSRSEAQGFAHAALAAYVAFWNAYLSNLVHDFYQATSSPLDVKYNAAHTLAKQASEITLSKFNTPNWENSRNLLIQCTSYDPLPVWVWPAKGFSSLMVKELLNQILKVRHSFAHGFAIPGYPWNTTSSGDVRLNTNNLKIVRGLFLVLVQKTDKGLKNHLISVYGSCGNW